MLITSKASFAMHIELTDAEKEYLHSIKELKIAGLDNFPPFSFVVDGKPTGYSIEYTRLIEKLLNKKVRIITAPWNDLLQMIQSGELDVIPHIAVTDERKKYIDYTDFIHISYTTGFLIRKDAHITSMADFNGKIIAVTKNTFLNTYLAKNFPEINLYTTESTLEAIEALNEDKAFAVIGNLPSLNYYVQENWLNNLKSINVKDLGLPAKTALPMGVKKGNFLLKSILEKANDAVSTIDINELKQKWIFSSISRDSNELSESEKDFIQQHPVVRFYIRKDTPPFEFEENGEIKGIIVNYIKQIASNYGIQAKFVTSNKSITEIYEEAEHGRKNFDTLAYTVADEAIRKNFEVGDDFLSYPLMIIVNANMPYVGKTSDLNGKKLITEKHSQIKEWIKRDHPKINIIEAGSTDSALKMLNSGLADAYIGNSAVANYLITFKKLKNIRLAAPTEYGAVKYSFIAPKELPELAAILSKGYRSLPPDFHYEEQQRWFSLQLVEKIDYKPLWKILSIGVALLAWILWWNRKLAAAKKETEEAMHSLKDAKQLLQKQNEQLERLSTTDKLTGIYNRLKLDEVLKEEIDRAERYGAVFGVIILDIDHFKRVNDTFGHLIGDKTLISLSEILLENIRKVDTVGRWGGEEFLVLCPESDLNAVIKVAENLQSKINSFSFEKAGSQTASFGLTVWRKGDDSESLVGRADRALYISKENGRNRISMG